MPVSIDCESEASDWLISTNQRSPRADEWNRRSRQAPGSLSVKKVGVTGTPFVWMEATVKG
jgi:hypothetical protein